MFFLPSINSIGTLLSNILCYVLDIQKWIWQSLCPFGVDILAERDVQDEGELSLGSFLMTFTGAVAICHVNFCNLSLATEDLSPILSPLTSISNWGLVRQVAFSEDDYKRFLLPRARLIMWCQYSSHSLIKSWGLCSLPLNEWAYDTGKNDVIWLLWLSHKRWWSQLGPWQLFAYPCSH